MLKQEISTREKFNYLKEYYDNTWDEKNHTLHVGLFKKDSDSLHIAYEQATDYLIGNVLKILPIDKNSKILDIGCGTGRTLIEVCLKYGCHGVGIDLSDEQIKDANAYLQKINMKRSKKSLLHVTFIRASGSDLKKVFQNGEQFTHIISQDAILLVKDKKSLFNNIQRLLIPGGVFGVADFLSESVIQERTKKEENLVYKLINWDESLSFETYEEILKSVGLDIVTSERRDKDMILTYEKLAEKMSHFSKTNDTTYSELGERYKSIVTSVKNGKMGWGFFFTQKPLQKTALITGTKNKSIGRFVARHLHDSGWNIILYSRSAEKIDTALWHERKCDISKEKNIDKMLQEIENIDLVMMLADSGECHMPLEKLSEANIKSFLSSKLTGTFLLNKALLNKFPHKKEPIKIVWCAGKISKKTKDLILYSAVNSGVAAYIDELNSHYPNIFKAYYLPTPLILPSTLGEKYIKEFGSKHRKLAQPPQIIVNKVLDIIDDKVQPGMINMNKIFI